MKKPTSTIYILFTITIMAILLSVSHPKTGAWAMQSRQASEEPGECDSSRTVNVSGTAIVNVPPDRALVQLGVESNGNTPREVEALNADAIQKVIQALQSLGIASKDIVTDRYIVEPVYESYNSLYIKGYRINNLVAVTLRNVEKVSQVVVKALEAGANQVVNVELYTSKLRTYRDQAREMAMVAAKEKAQALAAVAGEDAGCVLSITENSWSYYNGWWSRDNRDLWTQNVMQNVAPSGDGAFQSEDGPVSLGQISVRAEVSATFGLK